MAQIRCENFEKGCPFADGSAHEADSLEEFRLHKCEVLTNGGNCIAFDEATTPAASGPSFFKRIYGTLSRLRTAVIGLAGVALIGVAVFGIYKWLVSGPECEIAQANLLLKSDSKVGELERVGSDCLEQGIRDADVDKIVTGTIVLRTANDRKSPRAAWLLGRLFDPLKRSELDEVAAVPTLLPAPDASAALKFYDAAGSLNEDAAAAAAALRRRYPELSARVAGKGGQPLQIAGHSGLMQRVLTKPGTQLRAQPGGGAAGTQLDPLSINYVFEKRSGWLRIGQSLAQGPAGWVVESDVEDWNVMLVMRYAPPDNREPALFFRDELTVKSILNAPDSRDVIAQMRRSTATSEPDPRVVAVEDRTVDWSRTPYLMPILRTSSTVTDDGRRIYLAQVASISGRSTSSAGAASGGGMSCRGASLSTLVHQVVFVIDTTASMGPYIDGVRRIADQWVNEVTRLNVGDKFRFGVVGYRNNMDEEPQRSGLEYVTQTFLRLSPTSDAGALRAAMGNIRPASVSTHSFNEDAAAGLDDALKLDWGQACGARMIVLVTDAGTLASDDPKASRPGLGLSTIAATANGMDVSIFPVHIKTKAARDARNVEFAAGQYQRQLTDGRGVVLYRAIPNGSTKDFTAYLNSFGRSIPVFANEKLDKPLDASQFAKAPIDLGNVSVEQLVLGKIFAAQQRFLGQAAGVTAPTFTASWTSDRDLTNPNIVALDVNILLTRQQLGQLAEKCRILVDNARQAKSESSRFFDMLRMVSAATAQDPKRFANPAMDLKALMPSFLTLLPYKSDVLTLTAQEWRAMGATKQVAFVTRLEEKLRYYQRVDADRGRWVALGDGEEVAQIPLREMP